MRRVPLLSLNERLRESPDVYDPVRVALLSLYESLRLGVVSLVLVESLTEPILVEGSLRTLTLVEVASLRRVALVSLRCGLVGVVSL